MLGAYDAREGVREQTSYRAESMPAYEGWSEWRNLSIQCVVGQWQ